MTSLAPPCAGTTAELFRALAVVSEGTSTAHHRVAATVGVAPDTGAHTDLFCFQLPPYGAIYLGAEGMLGGEAAERVAGFWRALGASPPPEPDHLAALLGLYAAVVDAEAGEEDAARRVLWGEAARALLWEHLLPWVPVYALAAARIAAAGYRPWAESLTAGLLAEAEARPVGDGFRPLHFREAPELAAPADDGLDDFLARLLIPIRSGMVLTRRDLSRAARSLGLGLRMGERRFVLSTLVAQDPPAVLAWLAAEARGWAEEHDRLVPVLGPIATFWSARAQQAESLLVRLADGRS